MKKRIALCAVALLLTGGLAQEAATTPTLEIRLSIVENRLGRLESDVSRLTDVPTQLARIEEKLTALTEKANNQGGVLQQLAMSLATLILGGGIGWLFHARKKEAL